MERYFSTAALPPRNSRRSYAAHQMQGHVCERDPTFKCAQKRKGAQKEKEETNDEEEEADNIEKIDPKSVWQHPQG